LSCHSTIDSHSAVPKRLFDVLQVIFDTLRARRLPVTLSALSPSSLRSLFPSPSEFSLRPGLLTTTFFPHLKGQQSLALAVLYPPSRTASLFTKSDSSTLGRVAELYAQLRDFVYLPFRFLSLPLELTRQECRHNRKALEKIRDQRASILGELAQLRASLGSVMLGSQIRVNGRDLPTKKYTTFLDTLSRVVVSTSLSSDLSSSPLIPLDEISETLSIFDSAHTQFLLDQRLLKPSRLTRLWPSLLIVPPLSLYVYTSYTSWIPALVQMSQDAKETVRGFVEDWLVEPLVGVLRTVRSGARGEVLVREEGVIADLEVRKLY